MLPGGRRWPSGSHMGAPATVPGSIGTRPSGIADASWPRRSPRAIGGKITTDSRPAATRASPESSRASAGPFGLQAWCPTSWVDDTFAPYPDFVCDPYREYSEPYFGKKKVLKGGACTTRSRLIRATWRNFFVRHRRNVLAGFRTVAR